MHVRVAQNIIYIEDNLPFDENCIDKCIVFIHMTEQYCTLHEWCYFLKHYLLEIYKAGFIFLKEWMHIIYILKRLQYPNKVRAPLPPNLSKLSATELGWEKYFQSSLDIKLFAGGPPF